MESLAIFKAIVSLLNLSFLLYTLHGSLGKTLWKSLGTTCIELHSYQSIHTSN